MTQKLAILGPSPGLVRRIALGHARLNLDAFLAFVRETHGRDDWRHVPSHASLPDDVRAQMPQEALDSRTEHEIAQAERGLMSNSLMAAESGNDLLRGLPVYCSRAVTAQALLFLASEITRGVAVPMAIHDCPAGFTPWPASRIADAATNEARSIREAPSAPWRW